ncbi:hypothetical protein TTRE_0000607101 [Trichuris trichiura]|uniref:Uncharacterized protein n=1 Tax=Trichuris trichiura TaxID=36087 RepID=A0A077ZBM7_TRITR|nr:hypothetical protein TTRE_0000607101 [Trichuris trichiura]
MEHVDAAFVVRSAAVLLCRLPLFFNDMRSVGSGLYQSVTLLNQKLISLIVIKAGVCMASNVMDAYSVMHWL